MITPDRDALHTAIGKRHGERCLTGHKVAGHVGIDPSNLTWLAAAAAR